MGSMRHAGPTLQQVLAGYRRFNEWEREEMRAELPRLSVEESLRQYFELCSLSRELAPDAQNRFLEEYATLWTSRWQAFQRLTEASRGTTT